MRNTKGLPFAISQGMKNKYTPFKSSHFATFAVAALMLFGAAPAHAQLQCSQVLSLFEQAPNAPLNSTRKDMTLLEKEFSAKRPPLQVQDQLNLEIARLRQQDATLAQRVNDAMRERSRGHSLKVDLSDLSGTMIAFVEGPFARVVGARGTSRPFVKISKTNDSTLTIHHEGDAFPIVVRWVEGRTTVAPVRLVTEGTNSYQLLELPATMKTKAQIDSISSGTIYALIAGSAMHKYISSSSSTVMSIAALLHDGQATFSRPTQLEAKAVRSEINADPKLRNKVRSLLVVAPTASGKTRVLGDAIVDQLGNMGAKKLIVVATKTPDLTAELARNIGSQLHTEVGPAKYRMVQWGGALSESMTTAKLIEFIDQSPVPVVLFTSYPTLAIRAPEAASKDALMARTRGLHVDEAHNATGETFTAVLKSALRVAEQDRAGAGRADALDVLGVTASPITRSQRTAELYDGVFWAAVDKPGVWAQQHLKKSAQDKDSDMALEWMRMAEQYSKAWERGEINASEPIQYKPEERGFDFASIFKRDESGTQSSVNLERLKAVWPDVAATINNHGTGVIHTYPRDAEPVAKLLSDLTGKNYVSLQKLSIEERGNAYTAFRDQTPFRGRKIDAIVGTIREGLDFPQAGWYLSLKKFVKFPENIQGPGRVVRLALNKPNPVIMFFGQEVDRASYQDVKDLVMTRLGQLPRQFPEGRLYTGMRKGVQRAEMVKTIDKLNVAMEAFLRLNSEAAKGLGQRGEINPAKVTELQNILKDLRFTSENREIDVALNQFIFQAYSYPFFTGHLKSTWNWCDRMIAVEKLSAADRQKKRLSDTEIAMLNSPEMMAMIKEFRGFLSNIGPVPREILQNFELKILNVTEVAQATNAFVANIGKSPTDGTLPTGHLANLLRHSMSVSPEGLWRVLSPQAREVLKKEFDVRRLMSLEESVNDFYETTRRWPTVDFMEMLSHERDATVNLGVKLAKELSEKVRDGSLEVQKLSAESRKSLAESDMLAGMVLKMGQTLQKIKNENAGGPYIQRLRAEGLLTYENLMNSSETGLLKVLAELKETDGSKSVDGYINHIKEALK